MSPAADSDDDEDGDGGGTRTPNVVVNDACEEQKA